MILSTTDYLPDQKYKVLGVVIGNRLISFMSKTELDKAIAKLADEAKEMGADAVIGIRPYTTANGGTAAIGTAVKFI